MHQDGNLERQKHIVVMVIERDAFFVEPLARNPWNSLKQYVRVFGILGARHPGTIRDLLGVVAVLVPLSAWGNNLPLLLLLLLLLLMWSKVGCGCCGTAISCTMVTAGGSSCTIGLSSGRSFPPFLFVSLIVFPFVSCGCPIRVGGREGALARRPSARRRALPINQSINRPINQPINQSINQFPSLLIKKCLIKLRLPTVEDLYPHFLFYRGYATPREWLCTLLKTGLQNYVLAQRDHQIRGVAYREPPTPERR